MYPPYYDPYYEYYHGGDPYYNPGRSNAGKRMEPRNTKGDKGSKDTKGHTASGITDKVNGVAETSVSK